MASFGISNAALLDVLTAKVHATGAAIGPQGKLPLALANALQAVIHIPSGATVYSSAELYPFGFGLTC